MLVPEFLRLGIWHLLRGWTRKLAPEVGPRLALQLVNEAALCVTGVRAKRCLSQKGFELANGLPFVATDTAIHELLAERTMADSQALQVALGRVRQTRGHFDGAFLAIDPHRMPSHSKRQMARHRPSPEQPPEKHSQGFFCVDTATFQPLCATLASSSRTVAQATPDLLDLAAQILPAQSVRPLVMADSEHFVAELIDRIAGDGRFDLLVPMPAQPYYRRQVRQLPEEAFTHQWAGMATASLPFRFRGAQRELHQVVQRTGEKPGPERYRGFLCTAHRDEVELLATNFPDRWHVEEFFNLYQDMGWKKAGTLNLNIRYGRMTLALLAQAACHEFRRRIGSPFDSWSSEHLARNFFRGLDGDIRVRNDRIVVTYYNAPHVERLRLSYENLPDKLEAEGIDPAVPWLYNLKLDFRFK